MSDIEVIDYVPNTEIAVREIGDALSVDELVRRQKTVEQAMQRAMKLEVDYGHIPGIEKPTLLKPGAEKLCVLFQLGPTYPSERQEVVKAADGHLDVVSVCALRHIPTGSLVAEGVSYATSREKKYAYRSGAVSCPSCGAPEVRKSKRDDEFYCWKKQGGCGAVFPNGSDEYNTLVEAFKDSGGRVANPDLPDTYNTVLKMGAKRALIAAVLNATGASSIFTQDIEDTAPTPDPAPVAAAKKITESQRKRLFAVAKEHGVPDDRVKEIVKLVGTVESTKDIPASLYDLVIEALEKQDAAF